ncbi:glycosyltransferase [Mesorhizobium sp.]|uniref:glycosyltransferase n=1 Tax=Mesorhizobium sp. TaxID=1871066 RepID=UPI0025C59429|nr:glycosyltransferase [Mesorhizobium sp.]
MADSSIGATPYASYFQQRLRSRARKTARIGKSGISVITAVYSKTNVGFFLETAESIRAQTLAPDEWIVLSHGPISDELSTVLERLQSEKLLKRLTLKKNLGIQGGLRHCLEHSRGEFVLSLDADDLLTPDAIALLAEATDRSSGVQVLYSDEDIFVNGAPVHPFYRPAFDPVHLFSHSYVWHCILFRRSTALELGVYTDVRTEYAQDWDLLIRFVRAGHIPMHVPEVLYHWRHHASSLSNSGQLFDGSIASVKACLNSVAAGEHQHLLKVEEYPIGPAGSDYYLRRTATNLPRCLLVQISGSEKARPSEASKNVFSRKVHVRMDRGAASVRALREIAESNHEPFIAVFNGTVSDIEDLGVLQAFKHLELIASVQVVSGMIVNKLGVVLQGSVVRAEGEFIDITAGRPGIAINAHMFNVWKPHCIDLPCQDLMIVRRDFLIAALSTAPSNFPLRALSWWLGRTAILTGGQIAFEPLFMGFVSDDAELLGDPPASLSRAEQVFGPTEFDDSPARGLSRIAAMSKRHVL